MDEYIEQVVAEDVESSEAIVGGKRQVCYKARRPNIPDRLDIGEVAKGCVFDYVSSIIEAKRAMQGI